MYQPAIPTAWRWPTAPLPYTTLCILCCNIFNAACWFPTQNISCVGEHYDLALPRIGNFNLNGLTMQQLCAKPEYGGHPEHSPHGWCMISRRSPVDPSWGRVAFEGTESHLALTLLKQRIMLGCTYRCFCNFGLQDVSVQPRESQHEALVVRPIPASYSYEVHIDVVDDFDVPARQHMGRGEADVSTLRVSIADQVALNIGSYNSYEDAVSMSESNRIQCRGDLPRFHLPAPYHISDFASLQELCSVQWSGGRSYVLSSLLSSRLTEDDAQRCQCGWILPSHHCSRFPFVGNRCTNSLVFR